MGIGASPERAAPGARGRSWRTRLPVRMILVAVVLAGLSLLAFACWGEALERLFSAEALAAELAAMRPVGWLLAVGLLIADLVLPVPATGVMAALGMVYGFWIGWLCSAVGSALAGLLGYGLARLGGRCLADCLAGPAEQREFRGLFERWGGLAVIGSRAFPILPEVIAVLAGLAGMRLPRFVGALLAGTLPVAALYAGWGSLAGRDAPAAGLAAAVLLPLVLWFGFGLWWRRRGRRQAPPDGPPAGGPPDRAA